MTTIYKDFAKDIESLNLKLAGNRTRFLGGGRVYVDGRAPAVDNVHFLPVSESKIIHEALQKYYKYNAALQGRIWAGTAGEVNLNYIAATKAPAALLYDVNPLQRVFWHDFFKTVAACPGAEEFCEEMKHFSKTLYATLNSNFNLQAILRDDPNIRMKSPDPNDHLVSIEDQKSRLGGIWSLLDQEPPEQELAEITEPKCIENVEQFPSPFINQSYENFAMHFSTAMGRDTGRISKADKDLHWLANSENYRHLHLMAKNNALAALTLDITDAPSCAQLARTLGKMEYSALEIEGGTKMESEQKTGAKIGNLYTSNIFYYFNYTEEERREQQSLNLKSLSYNGRELSFSAPMEAIYAQILRNLQSLVTPDAAILNFDHQRETIMMWADFVPAFYEYKKPIKIPTTHEKGGLQLPAL